MAGRTAQNKSIANLIREEPAADITSLTCQIPQATSIELASSTRNLNGKRVEEASKKPLSVSMLLGVALDILLELGDELQGNTQ